MEIKASKSAISQILLNLFTPPLQIPQEIPSKLLDIEAKKRNSTKQHRENLIMQTMSQMLFKYFCCVVSNSVTPAATAKKQYLN